MALKLRRKPKKRRGAPKNRRRWDLKKS